MRILGFVNFLIERCLSKRRSGLKGKSKNFKLGIFVLGGLLLFISFILLLGASTLFEKRILIETYFDESVNGLNIGTVVKYRGVTIGNIKSISFVQNEYSLSSTSKEFSQGRLVVVVMSLQDVFKVSEKNLDSVLATMIRDGLRVRISSQGLTGISFLEFDYVGSSTEPEIEFSWQPRYHYVPSTRSTFQKIGSSIDDIIQKIDRANIDKFIINIDKLISTLDKGIQDANINQLGQNTNGLILELRETNKDLRKYINSPGMQKLPERMDEALSNLNKSMTKLNQILSNNQMEVSSTIENLKVVSQDLREVSNNAKKYPSLLLFGDAPSSPISGKK